MERYCKTFKIGHLFFVVLFLGTLQTQIPLSAQQSPTPEQRLQELGLTFPVPARPVANFVTAVRTGNLIFLAGHGPCGEASEKVKGKVGKERSIRECFPRRITYFES